MSADSIISKNLLEAIQKGREDEVEARLRLGEDVNSVFVMNRTPLHCAVANKMTRIVENLLKHKPNLTVSTIHKLKCCLSFSGIKAFKYFVGNDNRTSIYIKNPG